MKQQVFYIHGGESFSDYTQYVERLKTREIWDLPSVEQKGKWTSTLVADLGKDFEVFMPAMPNKQNAKYEEWKIWFERHFEYLEEEVILVGWSLGAMFLSRYLSEHKTPFSIKALFLLSPAAHYFVDPETGEDGGDFNVAEKELNNIKNTAEQIIIFHSKDDFVIPYDHALKFKEIVPEAELITFEDKNHFLIQEFPELVEKIWEVMEE